MTQQSTKDVLQRLRNELLCHADVVAFLSRNRDHPSSLLDLMFFLVSWISGMVVNVYGVAAEEPIAVLAGALMTVAALSCVSSLTHESWHGHLFQNRAANDFVSAWLLSPLLFADLGLQRRNHLMHHQYLGEPSDPDGYLYRLSTREFLRMLTMRALVVPYLLKLMGVYREPSTIGKASALLTKRGAVQVVTIQSIWIVAVFVATWIITGSLVKGGVSVTTGVFVPLALGSFLVALRGHREHFDISDSLTGTWETECNFLERWYISGGHFNLHATHHLFPEVPQRKLPCLSQLLRSKPEYTRASVASRGAIGFRHSYFSDARVSLVS